MRTRHVYPTDRIPHLWAHKTQEDARNQQGNLYFQGRTIYSYGSHFPIACHLETAKGPCVMFTTRSYSSTTAQHIYAVRRAIPSELPVFKVYRVTGTVAECKREHDETVKSASEALSQQTRKASKALKYRALQAAVAEGNEFLKWFDYKTRYKLPSNHAELEATASEYESTIQERRTARSLAQTEAWNRREAERRAEAAMTLQERIEAWRAGRYASFHYEDSMPTMLRIKGQQVETSRGAVFPVSHAAVGLQVVRRVMASGVEYKRNGHTIHLGHYPIDSITVDGTVTAGCHVVTWDEIQRIAPQLDAVVAEK